MYILRSLYLLWLIPRSWIDAVLVRKKPFAQRYACMKKWSERLLSHYRVTLDVQFQEQLPKDQPILFVCNHQSEFDMLLQMAVLDLPFTFISKKENEKVPYVAAWSKTLEVILFDREDRGSAIHMLREAARRLKAKDNPMQAGSMQPAFMAKACIVPIVLKNSYDYMDVMKHKGTFHIHILKPLYYEDYKPLKAEGVTVQLQEEMQRVLDEA